MSDKNTGANRRTGATSQAGAAGTGRVPAGPASGAAAPRGSGRRIGGQAVALSILFGLTIGVLIGINATLPRSPAPTAKTMAVPTAEPAPVHWVMASAFPASLKQLGSGGQRFAATLARISGGTIEVNFSEPGARVPAREVFAAVKSGRAESGWAVASYWAEEMPAASLFSAVPFGPGAGEFLAWMRFGGGQGLYDELYARHGVKGLPCAIAAPEASGWFRNEITSAADLKGLKMRFFGLGARVMDKFGVATELPQGDIFAAFSRGALDAIEYSMPAVDVDLGFHRIAKHYYFPGWHQQSTIVELLVSLDKWNALADRQRGLIEAACGDTLQYTLAEGEAIQAGALSQLRALGVELHRWSPGMLTAFAKAWREVAAETAAADADFRRAWDSLQAFRKDYAPWRDLGYLR